MNDALNIEARNKTGSYFKEGYNCAEAIFKAFREYLAPEMDPEMIRLVTGFGGGLGQAGCVCGALAASVVALNMLKGRTTNEGDRLEAYQCAQEFHDKFALHFGGTCCRALNSSPFDSKEHLTTCLKITGNTGKLLMEYLQEKNLYGDAVKEEEGT